MANALLKSKAYKADDGRKLFVSDGISHGTNWMTVFIRPPYLGGTHRLVAKSLPLRGTMEEAQRDLDAYASAKRLQEVPTDAR